MRYVSILFVLVLLARSVLAKEPITVYLAGDSTMAQKLPEKRPETGWGEALQKFFDPKHVSIENHAKNGRSTRTFMLGLAGYLRSIEREGNRSGAGSVERNE